MPQGPPGRADNSQGSRTSPIQSVWALLAHSGGHLRVIEDHKAKPPRPACVPVDASEPYRFETARVLSSQGPVAASMYRRAHLS